MELLKDWKNPNSPRGPIMIDPETRDIVQNEYMREVSKVGRRSSPTSRSRRSMAKDPEGIHWK